VEILQQFDPSQNNGQHVPLKIMLLQSLGGKEMAKRFSPEFKQQAIDYLLFKLPRAYSCNRS
jgi:hypothetical protein